MTDLPIDPTRYRIRGTIPAQENGVPSLEFYTYSLPWGDEEDAKEMLKTIADNMPVGTSVTLEETRDMWKQTAHEYVRPAPPAPRKIKDSPQA